MAPGVVIHVTVQGSGPPVLLLHGFPQTHRMWRRVVPLLCEDHTVIVPDYRGAGDSSRPESGYDKTTMAQDLAEVVERVAPEHPRMVVVGHDIGAMIAFALAAHRPEMVSRLVLVDAPVPGTQAWQHMQGDPRLWHLAFHAAPDIAEFLVRDRERKYLDHFFRTKAVDYTALADVVDQYVAAYKAPGALRAAFAAYRALRTDAVENQEILRSWKLPMPTTVIAAAGNGLAGQLESMCTEIAEESRFVRVADTGHWIAEEQPARLVEEIRADAWGSGLSS